MKRNEKGQASLEAPITLVSAFALLALLLPFVGNFTNGSQNASDLLAVRSSAESTAFLVNALYSNAAYSSISGGVQSACALNGSQIICSVRGAQASSPLLHSNNSVSAYEKTALLPV